MLIICCSSFDTYTQFDMDNYYGKQALKKMYEMIWACSTVSVIDSELDENSDKLYVEALKYIDAQLIPAVESEGDWEEK